MKPYRNLRIKEWALEDRPREKLISNGKNSLSNAELLAILLGSGNHYESALDVSKKILSLVDNNLHDLCRLSVDQLKKIKCIGPVKAVTIIAAFELGNRRKEAERPECIRITSSNEAFRLMLPVIGDLVHEEFWILLMNRSNRCVKKQKISQGGISGTVIDIRLILKYAVELLASSMIICHNHPSGNLQPSEADNKITKKIMESAKIMDIQLLDHLIIADNTYFSYADNGLM